MITSSARRRDAVGSSVPSLRRQSYCLCLTSIDSKSQESGSEMRASEVFDLLDIGITLWIFDSCVHFLSVQFFKTNRFHPTQFHQPRHIFHIKSHSPPPTPHQCGMNSKRAGGGGKPKILGGGGGGFNKFS